MNDTGRILIVEDEAISALSLKKILEDGGYAGITITSNGEDAIRIVMEDPPDLILMDIRLSGQMSGIEATKKIKSQAEVPIIFMTGYYDIQTEKQINELLPAGFLKKPLVIPDLLNSIEMVFKKT